MGSTLGDESVIACVAGVKRRKGEFGRAREKGKLPSFLLSRAWSRAVIPFPFPFERLPRRLSQLGIVELTTRARDIASFKVDFHCRLIFPYERA